MPKAKLAWWPSVVSRPEEVKPFRESLERDLEKVLTCRRNLTFARRCGLTQAAEQLGVSRVALQSAYAMWQAMA